MRFFLKEEILLATRRCAGSKFQRVGSETKKARAPSLVLIRGTLSLFVLFDLRCCMESAKKEGYIRWLTIIETTKYKSTYFELYSKFDWISIEEWSD